jgi:hypothetical protein
LRDEVETSPDPAIRPSRRPYRASEIMIASRARYSSIFEFCRDNRIAMHSQASFASLVIVGIVGGDRWQMHLACAHETRRSLQRCARIVDTPIEIRAILSRRTRDSRYRD